MKLAMKLASIAWRLALAAWLSMLTWQTWQLRYAPAWIHAQIAEQGRETRAAALEAISEVRRDLSHEVDTLRGDLLQRSDVLIDVSRQSLADITRRADDRLRDLTARLDRQLDRANLSAAELTKIRGDVAAVMPPIRNMLEVASDNADLLGRCATQDPSTGEWIANPDCLANRLIPALKNVEHMAAAGERMAVAIGQETPATATAVRSTSQSIATIADHFARPASWIKGVLLTSARAVGKWFGF